MTRRRKRQHQPSVPAVALANGPLSGLSRIAMQERFGNWIPWNTSADGEAQYNLRDLRVFSRDLERTAPIATGAIETRTSYVIGEGLKLQSRIQAEELGLTVEDASAWQRLTESRFEMWASSQFASTHGDANYYDMQKLGYRSELLSGDVFVLLASKQRTGWPFRLALQIIEADRVSNPNWTANTATLFEGIEKDDSGAPFRAHIASHFPAQNMFGQPLTWQQIDFVSPSGRRNLIHAKRLLRPGQTRGMPELAPIISTLKQLDRYSNAEVDAAVNSAAIAMFTEMDFDAFEGLFAGATESRDQYVSNAIGWNRELNSGKAVNLLPGEKINVPNIGRPNPNYDPFFQSFVNLVAVGLNMPKEVLMKAFNSSYSASRAALMDAWRTFLVERSRWARQVCQVIYEEWLADAVALGIIKAPGFFADPFIRYAWSVSNWSGDGPGALDPLKEAQADTERINNGTTTRAKACISFDGSDWEDVHRQLAIEESMREADGLNHQDSPQPQTDNPPTDQNQ